ncbi:ADAMTS-like protein 5 isoform X2 [Corticium candelabrum]|uniref:ADAMTS-like protein 5 isoform X2 n=1 Tax=Corticium candelabrum TaxID=121492 RepID=UPI002E25B407|nr:ADAMTS-like protein 5 isoform X2 [Corticium candelabrum]
MSCYLLLLSLIGLLQCFGTMQAEEKMGQTFRRKRQLQSLPQWYPWSPWTPCTHSCGIGITQRERFCIVTSHSYRTSVNLRTKFKCQGESHQYEVCNTSPCRGNIDYSYRQCQSDLGSDWITFVRSDLQPCVVYCENPRLRQFRGLWASNGTNCAIQGGHRGVCVQRKCRPVGCDNRLGSLARLDVCGVCNGDASQCNMVHKSKTQTLAQKELGRYIHLFTIPEKVRSLVVQNSCSQKYFAVSVGYDEMVINSNLTVTPSKTVWAAGTSLAYERRGSHETIRGEGPTTHELLIFLIAIRTGNCNVRYSYSLPKGNVRSGKDLIPGAVSTKGGSAQNSVADSRGSETKKVPIGIPKCPPCNKAMGRAHYFCSSDFVISARLSNKIRLRSQIRYNLEVVHSYKPNLDPTTYPMYLWSESLCDCHHFRENRRYLIMGTQSVSKWVVGSEDFVREWKSSWDLRLRHLTTGEQCARQ